VDSGDTCLGMDGVLEVRFVVSLRIIYSVVTVGDGRLGVQKSLLEATDDSTE